MTRKQVDDLGLHVDEMPEWELDVVCGMDVDPRTTQYQHTFDDRTYYFCNKNCLKHFIDNPKRYALGKKRIS